ncbi:carbohydrate kinase family protein [Nocardia jejuensis]|uniref:carbohydrate kinase family protein n=1 Tax=Nocardia jejuensis TaxID=328049 RepID=UPI00082A8481|nr:PfkB family carbohydrate kinase [Nocardia jejuensis]
MAAPERPIVCVSYLASAELWHVPHFPEANHGAEIRFAEHSIAADGPMTAAVLAALDVPTMLIANDFGCDADGRQVSEWLQRHGVQTTAAVNAGTVTPRVVVVAADDDTRTWFAHLPGVAGSLERVDLSTIACASFVYLDAYQLIENAALRVIRATRAGGTPLLLNLGGSPLSDALQLELRNHENLLIQTNVDDAARYDASELARQLLAHTSAEWAVVTAGAAGSLAASRKQSVLAVPAFPVQVHHTHCAGAAFSGGLLYGLREGMSIDRSMRLGAASGALRCTRHHSAPLPTLFELESIAACLDRLAAD